VTTVLDETAASDRVSLSLSLSLSLAIRHQRKKERKKERTKERTKYVLPFFRKLEFPCSNQQPHTPRKIS